MEVESGARGKWDGVNKVCRAQFSHRGGNDSSTSRGGGLPDQNTGKMGELCIPAVCASAKGETCGSD